MFLHHLSMNLLRILVASWSIFILVQETFSLEKVLLPRYNYRAPLAVITNDRDSSLQLAIPHHQSEENDRYYVAYNYDNSDDANGPKEKLMIACPASDEKQLEIQENWKNTDAEMLSKSTLLFLSEYTNPNALCSQESVPSINKIKEENSDDHVKHCNKKGAEMYEVGYPVSNDEEGKDVRFLSTYEICYSKTKGKEATLYSIHRIKSPNLLFTGTIKELPKNQPLVRNNCYESILDSSLSTKETFKRMAYYKHQFVGEHDISPWEQTTFFFFNYTPITRNEDLYKGMIRADWYIRLLSKKRNKPLTLYSGTYKRRMGIRSLHWAQEKVFRVKPRTSIDYFVRVFWRIILDDEGYAIILAIQHNLSKCEPAYLCKKILKLKTYENGSCIYTCSIKKNNNLFKKLGLPPLPIAGDLHFKMQSDKEGADGLRPFYDIVDFLDNESFRDALLNIDSNILQNAYFQKEIHRKGVLRQE